MDLILISAFTAFFIAVAEPALSLLSVLANGRFVNGVSSLLFSGTATYLVGINEIKQAVIYTVAGAFIGNAAITGIEAISLPKTRTYGN